MLLDAGEGTWQQMVRMAYHTPSLVAPNPSDPRTRSSTHEPVITSNSGPGPDIPDNAQDHGIIHRIDCIIDYVETVLARDLKVIWISHPHADHHLGLLMILSERKRLLTARCKRMKENAKKVMNRPVVERVSVVGKTHNGDGKKSKKIEKEEKEDESKFKNEYGESEEFHPLLLIAPPSILSFLRDFCELDTGGLVRGSYIPVSSRQFDKRDNCKNGDSYWQDIVKENLNAVFGDEDLEVKSENSEGKNSTSDASTESNYSTRPAFQQNWQIVAKENLLLGKKILSEVGIVDLENVKVIHCPQAFGLVMQLSTTTDDLKKCATSPSDMLESTPSQSPSIADSDLDSIVSDTDPRPAKQLKIVYSGDTRPSPLLTAIGRDATILIHEATFEDDEAGAFRHKYPAVWLGVMWFGVA
jgi:ribonuclease BN (tRNA processing enzyme)